MQGSSVFSHNFFPFSTSFLYPTSTTHAYSHFPFKPTKFNSRDSTRALPSHFASLSHNLPTPRRRLLPFKVRATAAAESDQPKWWEKNTPNMVDVHSTQDFLDALSQAGDRLVIVDFYGTWCASCRALFPKLCKIAVEYPEILFIKVNFDENKSLCKSLNIKVLPFFHFYRGADGLLDSFSCSLVKLQKLKDAIASYNPADTKENLVRGNDGGDS